MGLPVLKVQQRAGVSTLLKKEVDPELCRGTGTLLGGSGGARTVVLGQLLGKISGDDEPEVTASAADTNTGDGVLTLAEPAFTSAVKPGRYTITFVGEASNSGNFKVEGPNGVAVGAGKVGTAFTKQVKFTIADGSTDFAVGDMFFIDVEPVDTEAAGKLVAWDPTATNGSQVIHGVSLGDYEAAEDEDLAGIVFSRRLSVLNATAIVWPEGISAGDKAAAIADMEDRLGLIVRA